MNYGGSMHAEKWDSKKPFSEVRNINDLIVG